LVAVAAQSSFLLSLFAALSVRLKGLLMDSPRTQLTASIRRRRRSRLATADAYLRSCLDVDEPPSRYFPSIDYRRWEAAVKEAETRLVSSGGRLGPFDHDTELFP